MFLTSLLLSLTPHCAAPPLALQNRREKVTASYHELAKAKDAAGLEKLWKENVSLVLQTIDADLEGSLALWEKSPEKPPMADIEALQARAMFGAEAATRALSEPIFVDYASSFIGWNDIQKQAFRAGQQVYGRAMQEMKDENFEVAAEAGSETVLRAIDLGDWWGAAMGYGAVGDAQRHLGSFEESLVAYSMARQINHALGLQFSEYQNLLGMMTVARALERPARALAAARAALEYARAFKDNDSIKSTLEVQLALEKELGLEEAAKKSAEELKALK